MALNSGRMWFRSVDMSSGAAKTAHLAFCILLSDWAIAQNCQRATYLYRSNVQGRHVVEYTIGLLQNN